MTKYKIEVDISDLDAELERLENAPGFKTILALESLLATQFAATQQQVHVDTHSLKTSGKIDSDLGRGIWKGEIEYGGISPGSFHDPVTYAIYEYERGGFHDFIRPAVDSDHLYGIIMDTFMRGLD